MPTHKHSKIKNRSTTAPFTEPVAAIPAALNPAAHFGLTQTDVCLCGATRLTNISGDQIERGPWTGGDPDYQRNEAAVALGSLAKGAMSEKKRLALVENAKKPRGVRAVRTEIINSKRTFPLDQEGKCAMRGEVAMTRLIFRCLTPGNRVSWCVRWFFETELVKVINSTKRPILDIDAEEREAEAIYRKWVESKTP